MSCLVATTAGLVKRSIDLTSAPATTASAAAGTVCQSIRDAYLFLRSLCGLRMSPCTGRARTVLDGVHADKRTLSLLMARENSLEDIQPKQRPNWCRRRLLQHAHCTAR
ncbi:hypothetical protein XFF6166_820002 [Xanthomonas citri pv. fuscans]|nr:hypothetical protein XFF6166_820002 [Xanthomonas citri pv. fuscans]SOO01613.1 hypothetical protein XFF6960_500002 [Xanthomonas citri pv. fuscans]SOO06257.1 hypothetical protein XFF7767_690002 [Xanthomonas citri pv. fuscans]SOO11471.1 hypothetical protein XFF6970_860001 [Xanthomonas citri pv. fuscans]SOO13182.1 hypothetical protein XFF7766_130002 [Xanthomonas citri pv. fuscans]